MRDGLGNGLGVNIREFNFFVFYSFLIKNPLWQVENSVSWGGFFLFLFCFLTDRGCLKKLQVMHSSVAYTWSAHTASSFGQEVHHFVVHTHQATNKINGLQYRELMVVFERF